MQIGMIGLGRMGADMVRRLLQSDHECVVFAVKAEAVKILESEGALKVRSLEDFASRRAKPRIV